LNFLLDENVPHSIKRLLQEKGYTAITLDEIHKQGISNGEVAKLSIKMNAVIITFDSDFLRLKKEFLKKIKTIYIKIHPRDPKVARELLNSYFAPCMTCLEKENIIILTKQGILKP